MMPLAMVAPGEKVRMVAIHGGRRLRKRLSDLGLTPGTIMMVVQSSGLGPIILALKDDSRLALGRGMSLKVQVELSPEANASNDRSPK